MPPTSVQLSSMFCTIRQTTTGDSVRLGSVASQRNEESHIVGLPDCVAFCFEMHSSVRGNGVVNVTTHSRSLDNAHCATHPRMDSHDGSREFLVESGGDGSSSFQVFTGTSRSPEAVGNEVIEEHPITSTQTVNTPSLEQAIEQVRRSKDPKGLFTLLNQLGLSDLLPDSRLLMSRAGSRQWFLDPKH